MIKKPVLVILFLALGHGINDLIAGFFLGSLVQSNIDLAYTGASLVVYNLLAFGGQYPIALWLRRAPDPKRFLLMAYALNIASVVIFSFVPTISIVLTGIASAIYHVAGGTVCAHENKAVNIGLFAAPGVAGLIAGGYLAYARFDIYLPLLITAILFLIILFTLPLQRQSYDRPVNDTKSFHLDTHDIVMILLLTVISLRSVIWNIFQVIHDKDYYWLIAIAASAFAGKIIGGWLADRVGWRLYTFSSLIIATPLITLFRKEMVLFCIGIGILQSGIPATTSLLIHSMKGEKEKAIALSFGTAIILGAFVLYSPLQAVFFSNYFICIVTAIALFLFWWAGRKDPAVI